MTDANVALRLVRRRRRRRRRTRYESVKNLLRLLRVDTIHRRLSLFLPLSLSLFLSLWLARPAFVLRRRQTVSEGKERRICCREEHHHHRRRRRRSNFLSIESSVLFLCFFLILGPRFPFPPAVVVFFVAWRARSFGDAVGIGRLFRDWFFFVKWKREVFLCAFGVEEARLGADGAFSSTCCERRNAPLRIPHPAAINGSVRTRFASQHQGVDDERKKRVFFSTGDLHPASRRRRRRRRRNAGRRLDARGLVSEMENERVLIPFLSFSLYRPRPSITLAQRSQLLPGRYPPIFVPHSSPPPPYSSVKLFVERVSVQYVFSFLAFFGVS